MTKFPACSQVLFKHSKLFLISIVITAQIFSLVSVKVVWGLDLNNSDEIAKEIEKLSKDLKASQDATVPLEQKLKSLNTQITSIQGKINKFTAEINNAEKQIKQKEADLEKQKAILAATVRSYYIKTFVDTPLLTLLSSNNATDVTRELTFRSKTTDRDKNLIVTITGDINGLKKDKEDLAKEKTKLAGLQVSLNKEADFYAKEVAGAKKYQTDLSNQIASLTARQNEIIASKSGTFTTGVGDVPLADDPNASVNFNPGFSKAFAAFSFGAYTHRKGMSQYGAKGRADAGQNFKTILSKYYGKEPNGKDTGGNIKVSGYGEMDFETKYLYGIAEMPSSFPEEALKAQAVAARTYAYRYKKDGLEICTTEACQVFNKSKSDSPPDKWKKAVDDTKGQVIEDVVTYYSSTTGGYLTTSGWDTGCGSKDCWTGDAFEKKANSPWFYKAWYTQSYSVSSDKCGKSNPWLNNEEFSDILNGYLLINNNHPDSGRVTPVSSCWGGSPLSMSEMRERAGQYGGAFTAVNSVSVSYSNDVSTASVTINSNRGTDTISGSKFKEAFNLRAPGWISIKSPLFNIEVK